MALFDNSSINFDVLKKRAFNYRWAEVGEGVIPLTAADPDFPVAPEIKKALHDFVEDGYFSYTPKMGYPEFRQAIAEGLKARKGEDLTAEQVLPIDSAARGMYVIAQTVLKPGDEMIIFDPVDYLFRESCLSAGGVPVLFPAKMKGDFIDLSELERYITPKTRMIGLCNPHNPFGCVYRPEDLDALMKLCEKHDMYIMNDEIWSDIVYSDAKFTSILSLGAERCQRVMSVFGFSKSFGLAGLRIGCVYTQNPALFQKIVDCSAVMTTAGGLTSISQIAGTVCMTECYGWVDQFLRHLQGNRDYALERLAKMPLVSCRKPDATYLLYVDIHKVCEKMGTNSEGFIDYLKKEYQLALVAGGEKFFGPGSEGCMRICFATSREVLTEGLNRLEKGLNALL
ncbi:MAG: pyridoxal phosphate-dependent aminotransferase [Eubacteriales bacterium]|nr:pyridoxal phosphate-dependent aminotransferase [Eubacteriales bacterium]